MSEKLIDHHFVEGGFGGSSDRCMDGYSAARLVCGQPRSRHRQAEKAQDFGERPRECQLDELFGCIETHGFPTDSEAWSKIVEPALAACAGAADPQPGELAQLRASDRACGSCCGEEARAVKAEERAAKAEASLAQALLVLKALGLKEWGSPNALCLEVSRDITDHYDVLAAFEALRKDGLL